MCLFFFSAMCPYFRSACSLFRVLISLLSWYLPVIIRISTPPPPPSPAIVGNMVSGSVQSLYQLSSYFLKQREKTYYVAVVFENTTRTFFPLSRSCYCKVTETHQWTMFDINHSPTIANNIPYRKLRTTFEKKKKKKRTTKPMKVTLNLPTNFGANCSLLMHEEIY